MVLDNKQFDEVGISLDKLSLAKNIKLMEGTFKVWVKLIEEDILACNFEMEDFMHAINVGVRSQMYNRIDYADIYQEANERYKKRMIKRRQEEENAARWEYENRPKSPVPQEIKDMLAKNKGNVMADTLSSVLISKEKIEETNGQQ